jgi:hypothetical protein
MPTEKEKQEKEAPVVQIREKSVAQLILEQRSAIGRSVKKDDKPRGTNFIINRYGL